MARQPAPQDTSLKRVQQEIFSKPGLQVSVYPQGESAGNAQQLCVRMVSIP